MPAETYFAQFTDVHISMAPTAEAANADRFLSNALHEVAELPRPIKCIVITGDIGSTQSDPELRRYRELAANTQTPIYAVPSGNHDAWRSDEPWNQWMGPHRHCIDLENVRLILMGEVEPGKAPTWHRAIRQEELAWLEQCLAGAGDKPAVVGFHSPLLLDESHYMAPYTGENVVQLLELLARYRVLGLITGHWHLNAEWQSQPGNVRIINTGALCGWSWNGVPPQPRFGLRSGYRLFRVCNGELQTIWRDLEMPTQVSLATIDGIHMLGPRPQVRTMEIGRQVSLQVQAMSLQYEVRYVEWAMCYVTKVDAVGRETWVVHESGWQPLHQRSAHLWSDWEGRLDPAGLPEGSAMLMIRARQDDTALAYDTVPVVINRDGEVRAGSMRLFLPWNMPKA